MKQIITLLLFGILTLSCGSDELVVKNTATDNITGNTGLAQKLRRLAQYPTAIDNLVDNSSCFSIEFPYSITVNDQDVTVISTIDYQTVLDIMAIADGDDDTISFQFPITAVYPDYSKITFSNQAQLTAARVDCTVSVELSCIDFDYPLGLKTYNSENQLAEAFTVNSKKGLYEVLTDVGVYDAVTITYPIIFNTPDGLFLTLQNNSQLEEAIDDYTEECLALLNIEPGTDPGPDPVFTDLLIQGSWYVAYFFRDSDQTDNYQDFDFTFNTNGSVTVTGVANPGTGTWASYTDSGDLNAEFTFTNNNLGELEEDWRVTDFSATLIKMQHESGGGSEIRYLYLAKN